MVRLGLSFFLLLTAVLSTTMFAQIVVPTCPAEESPTGCFFPHTTCMQPAAADPVTSCQRAAKRRICTDFSWEKCCFITCTPKKEKSSNAYAQCMDLCGAAAEATMYWPKAPVGSTKKH